jgi:hypothetical protein
MGRPKSARAAVVAIIGTVTLTILGTTKGGTAVIPGWVTLGLIPLIWLGFALWYVRDLRKEATENDLGRCQNCGRIRPKDELEQIDGVGNSRDENGRLLPWVICLDGCQGKISGN